MGDREEYHYYGKQAKEMDRKREVDTGFAAV
jgi:hypothetical protein